jgi:hypothetical protein
VKGRAFYQLTKTETVQDYKEIIVEDRTTGKLYRGARSMIGMPDHGSIRLVPKNLGNYNVYVASTSVNRKLVPGTVLIYER